MEPTSFEGGVQSYAAAGTRWWMQHKYGFGPLQDRLSVNEMYVEYLDGYRDMLAAFRLHGLTASAAMGNVLAQPVTASPFNYVYRYLPVRNAPDLAELGYRTAPRSNWRDLWKDVAPSANAIQQALHVLAAPPHIVSWGMISEVINNVTDEEGILGTGAMLFETTRRVAGVLRQIHVLLNLTLQMCQMKYARAHTYPNHLWELDVSTNAAHQALENQVDTEIDNLRDMTNRRVAITLPMIRYILDYQPESMLLNTGALDGYPKDKYE